MIYIEEAVIYYAFAISYGSLFLNIDVIMKHTKVPLNYMVLPATVLSCYLATSMTLDVLGICKKEPSQ
jgi:hypothetical protein